MANRMQQHYWAFLYNDFLLQTEPAKLQARLGPLEGAIFERWQELNGSAANSHAERLVINEASRKILQVKVEKLGFPPITGKAPQPDIRAKSESHSPCPARLDFVRASNTASWTPGPNVRVNSGRCGDSTPAQTIWASFGLPRCGCCVSCASCVFIFQ